MQKKRVLSLLVKNHSGVLSKIALLFTRRGYNIHSLSVGITENPKRSRMTIEVIEDKQMLEQIVKQLNKLLDVIKVTCHTKEDSVIQDLCLIKLKMEKIEDTNQILLITRKFNAKIVDFGNNALILEFVGREKKVGDLLQALKNFEIIEYIQTGVTAMKKTIDNK